MKRVLTMNDFEVYLHDLARGECSDDVCTVPDSASDFFSEDAIDEFLTDLMRQLFSGLDAWESEGNLNTWHGTIYARSILAFIGRPVAHGRLIGTLDDMYGSSEMEEDDW